MCLMYYICHGKADKRLSILICVTLVHANPCANFALATFQAEDDTSLSKQPGMLCNFEEWNAQDQPFAKTEQGFSVTMPSSHLCRLHVSHVLHMPWKSRQEAIHPNVNVFCRTSSSSELDFAVRSPAVLSNSCPQVTFRRVGEASNPGPEPSKLKFSLGLTNPTSIVSKLDIYREIIGTFHLDMIACAETSATQIAQTSFTRGIRSTMPYQTWSMPVQDHVQRSGGAPSQRGKAGGTCLLSRVFDRRAVATLAPEWEATTRVTHSVATIGTVEIQVLVVYCLPGNRQGAMQFNTDLIHAALDAAAQLPLPTVLAGDFNGHPLTWGCGGRMKQLGFLGIDTRYQQLHHRPMPPTCKEATVIDLAFVPLQAHDWVTQVQIVEEPFFDAHKLVVVDFAIPGHDAQSRRYVMPRSFLDFDVPPELWEHCYETCTKAATPTTLQQWASGVEASLDAALRKHHVQDCGTPAGLPTRYRGRCKPPSLRQAPMRSFTRQGRPTDYQPTVEVHTRQAQQMVRQCRRLESLQRLLAKGTLTAVQMDTASHDWKAIRKCRAFGPNFLTWCSDMVTLGPISGFCPTYDQVTCILEIAKFHTDAALQVDKQTWIQKLEFDRTLDQRQRSHARAYARLRNAQYNPLQHLSKTCQELAILHCQPEGTLLVYLNSPEQFSSQHTVMVDGQPTTFVSRDAHSLIVAPQCVEYDWPHEAEVMQDFQTSQSQDRLAELQRMPHATDAKIHLVVGGIYPVAFYGAELVPLGCSHTDAIRTAVCDAVLGPSPSRNNYVAMLCMPGILDPELHVIKVAISAAQRYLRKASQSQRQSFIDAVCEHSGTSHKCRGPAGALRHYLNRIDWQLDKHGRLQVATFEFCDFLTLGAAKLTRLLLHAWSGDLLTLHSSRAAWKGHGPIHAEATRRVVRTFPPSQQKLLLNEISGAFQTASQQAKWDPQTTPNCIHCDQLDNREHRIYHCPATEDIRRSHVTVLDAIQQEGFDFHELPVMTCHPSREFFRMICDNLTPPTMDETLQARLRSLTDAGHTLRFFTDGSCIHNDCSDAAHAAYAVVLDTADTDQTRMHFARHWTVDRQAHQDISLTHDALLKYDRIGNFVADASAQLTCQHQMSKLVAEADDIFRDMDLQERLPRQYYAYFLELQRQRAQLRGLSHQHDTHRPHTQAPDTICDRLIRYMPLHCWELPTPTVDHGRDFAWGPTWSRLFLSWIEQLRWPTDDTLELQEVGVTWIEMSMSLMLTSGMWLPLRRRAQDGKDRLVVFDTYDQLMAYDVSFAEFADTTQQMFTQMAVLRDTALHPPVQRRLVTSGYLQGFSIHSSGLAEMHRWLACTRLIAKVPVLSCWAYKTSIGQPMMYPRADLSFAENFLYMMFATPMEEYKVNPVAARAINAFMILHMDHETGSNVFCTGERLSGNGAVAGHQVVPDEFQEDDWAALRYEKEPCVASLWGPAHGGANEAVIKMLEEIGSAENVPKFVDDVKAKKAAWLEAFVEQY
eukprot:Skav204129  [mRNA]  locus=scaffold2473:102891:112311:+ [translate_table: standard]